MNVIIAAFLIILAIYLLAILTEEFFVPSIDKLSKKLNLSHDAAGATLLAAGSSAPEFFIAFISVVGISGDHADIGAGSVVGSAIFNMLVIIGLAAMYKSVTLQWQPVVRDLSFYVLTILLLLFVFWDGRVVLYEALAFVWVYIIYVFAVINWQKMLPYTEVQMPVEKLAEIESKNKLVVLSHRTLALVIPDPRRSPRKYIWTFLTSILVIGGLSWLLVEQVVVIAETLNINATFLALTVLAAGTSMPDLIGSMVVAKQGRGDMAVSNAVGSNIFDVLFSLGMPWMLVLLFTSRSVIEVSRDNLLASIALLFATVISIIFLLLVRRLRIGQRSGLVLVMLYVAYCVYIFKTVA